VVTGVAVAAVRVGNPPNKSPQSFLGHPGLTQTFDENFRDCRSEKSREDALVPCDCMPRLSLEQLAHRRTGLLDPIEMGANRRLKA
jgi:hypothetical protein